MVLSLPLEYEFKNLFITLVISVVAINLIGTSNIVGSLYKEIKVSR